MHLVALGGSDPEVRRSLEAFGLSVRPARRGSASWRYESRFKSYGDAMEVVDRIRTATPALVRQVARLGDRAACPSGKNTLPFLPAASVRPGMAMFAADGSLDMVEKVERVAISAPVYDLDVEATHNFIAGGLVTHNSIYRFRGADIRNILDYEHDWPDAVSYTHLTLPTTPYV